MSEPELPEYSACPWPINPGCCNGWDEYEPAVQARAIAMASAVLSRLTAFRVTNCPVTVRPCKPRDVPRYGYFYLDGSFFPNITADRLWVNSCGHRDSCSCTSVCRINLPGPIGRVDEVKLNGTVLDADTYRADELGLIWQSSDPCPWPTCQDLSKPDTEDGTFSVTYILGYPPDALAADAMGVLACEFAKACTGKGTGCRLPAGVTAVVRQGVTLEVVAGSFPGGMTGIREIDSWITLWNPKGRIMQSTVWSPDLERLGLV